MNRDALVIGINRYPYLKDTPTSAAKHLQLPANDAENIAQLLKEHGNFRVHRFPESLIDGKWQVDPKKVAKVEELEAEIEKLFIPKGDRVPDTALLFFAGHGLKYKPVGDVEKTYLATSDASERKNIWGVSLSLLREILRRSPIKQQIIFLDCCKSGELFNFSFDELQLAESDKLRFFVTASREDENAYGSLNSKHGVLTKILLEGLDPHRISGGVIDTINLKNFIENCPIETPQKPLVSNGNSQILLTAIPEKKYLLENLKQDFKADKQDFRTDKQDFRTDDKKGAKNWNLLHTFTGHVEMIKSVAISPDRKIIASGSLDHNIKLWDVKTGQLLQTLTEHSSGVTCVTFSKDGKTLVSSSANPDGTIKFWDVKTGNVKANLKSDDWIVVSVWSIALSSDGKTLVSGHHADNTVKIWNLSNQTIKHTLRGHVWAVHSVALSPDGKTVASGSFDSNVKVWNAENGRQIYNLNGPADSPVGLVKSWFSNNIVYTVAFSPDGKTLASGGEKQPIKLWNLSNGKERMILTGHSAQVYSVVFSPDGKTLASGSGDGTIRIWDLFTGETTDTFVHSDAVYSLAFSVDGQILVSGSKDRNIKVWKLG